MFRVSEFRVQPRVGLSKTNGSRCAGGAFFCCRFTEKGRSKDTWEQFSNTTELDHLQVGSCPLGGLNDPLRGSSHRQLTVISVVHLLRVTRTPKSPQEVKSLLVLLASELAPQSFAPL